MNSLIVLFYRCVFNPVRRWSERDDRLRVEHWKAVMGPRKPVILFHQVQFLGRGEARGAQRRAS